MTGQELINETIQFYDNTSAADLENANRRLRILHYAQLVQDEVWNWRAWPFKFNNDTVSCSAGAGSLPTDFARLGPEGMVYEETPKSVWTEASPGDVLAVQLRGESQMRIFAVTTYAGDFVRKLIIPDTAARTLKVYYEASPPALADDSNEITGIPSAYHRTVLLAGTVARTQTSKNDVRMQWEGQFRMGLGRMVVNEMPLASRMKQMPMSVGRNNF